VLGLSITFSISPAKASPKLPSVLIERGETIAMSEGSPPPLVEEEEEEEADEEEEEEEEEEEFVEAAAVVYSPRPAGTCRLPVLARRLITRGRLACDLPFEVEDDDEEEEVDEPKPARGELELSTIGIAPLSGYRVA